VWQASSAFNSLLERWLRDYGFVSIRGDKVTFKYEDDNSAIIILSLYVDDRLAATNNQEVYQQFLKASSAEFELSECRPLKWYLGVSIKQDLIKGTTTINQEQYINQLLARFSMAECTPKSTPMAPGSRLVRAGLTKERRGRQEDHQRVPTVGWSTSLLSSMVQTGDSIHGQSMC
jgi:hypothetical protein